MSLAEWMEVRGQALRKWAQIQIQLLAKRLAAMDMTLNITESAIAEIANAGFDPVYGARPLKRAIQQAIENPISRLILEGKFGPNDVIPVDVDGNEFIFTRQVH